MDKVTVYKIANRYVGGGFITDNPLDFKEEFENHVYETGDNTEFIEVLGLIRTLKPNKFNKIVFGDFAVSCYLLDKDKYENLPEFSGW